MNNSRVVHREVLARDVYKMTFATDACKFSRPGQYALVSTGDVTKPYQVCDYDSNRFTIVFKVRDNSDRILSKAGPGDEFDTETGLGNGFDVSAIPNGAVLAADSMGISDMLELSRALLINGKRFRLVLGYNSRDEIFMVDAFRNICGDIEVITLDGSNGRCGMASDAVKKSEYVCASGSPAMLKAVTSKTSEGQLSFSNLMTVSGEEDGAIDVALRSGIVKSSTEGPVFMINEVNWEDQALQQWKNCTQ